MKNKVWVIIMMFMIGTTFSACKSEKDKFSELLVNKNLSDAYKFQKRYPKSNYNIDSLIQSIEFYNLKKSHNVDKCNEFIAKFNYGIYTDSVKKLLNFFIWEQTTVHPTAESVENYIINNQNSPYISEAEDWLYKNSFYGTIIDKRDGQKYKWWKYGDQIWMVQNLNFQTEHSCYSNEPQGGRAYPQSEILGACIDGWDIPTLDDWYTLLFNNGVSLSIIDDRKTPSLNCLRLVFNFEGMGFSFRPYLKFDNVRYRYNLDCGDIYSGGATYWTNTTIYFQGMENQQCIHFEDLHANSTNGEYGMYIHNRSARIGAESYPIRCIRKASMYTTKEKNTEFLVHFENQGMVNIEDIKYNSNDLPNDGIYIPKGQNPEDFRNSILIKYFGNRMFFLVYRGIDSENKREKWVNYNVFNSGISNKFKLGGYQNYVDRFESGEFSIKNKTTIILRLNSEPQKEYILAPELKAAFDIQ